jgi:hypothetical protein
VHIFTRLLSTGVYSVYKLHLTSYAVHSVVTGTEGLTGHVYQALPTHVFLQFYRILCPQFIVSASTVLIFTVFM